MGTLQACATFWPPGELTNCLSLGSLMYWQRQGFCAVILSQQSGLGLPPDEIAPAQGESSLGLHVKASETLASATKISTTNAQKAAPYDAFIFTLQFGY